MHVGNSENIDFNVNSARFPCNTGRFRLCISIGSDDDTNPFHPRQFARAAA